jgi:peptidyl-prolyl cis-trans isomerase SurA
MKKIILAFVFAVMTAVSANAGSLQIVGVVNNDIITSYDFYNRVNMAIANTGLPKTQETFQKIAPIVMQELINESLQVQAARGVGLNMSEQEIEQAINTIAQRNNMSLEEFNASLTGSGIEMDTLRDQIKANILWRKYIKKRIAPLVSIAEEEVEEFIQKIVDNEGEQEYLIEEIFYPVDGSEIEASAKQMLGELLVEIKSAPDSFAELAGKFSKAPNGGQIGWVLPDALSNEIEDALSTMSVGDVSPVIRTVQGFSIIKLADERIVNNDINKITKEAVDYKLAMEKIEILQKRKLRDLKASAFIEVKMN